MQTHEEREPYSSSVSNEMIRWDGNRSKLDCQLSSMSSIVMSKSPLALTIILKKTRTAKSGENEWLLLLFEPGKSVFLAHDRFRFPFSDFIHP